MTMWKTLWPAALLGLLAPHAAAQAPPNQLHYQGFLTDAAGAPLHCPSAADCPSGPINVTFSIYDASAGGTPLWQETVSNVAIDTGVMQAILGDINPLTPAALANAQTYIGLAINGGGELFPRQRVVASAYAIWSERSASAEVASNADALGGLPSSSYVLAADIPALCVTDGELTQVLAQEGYLDEGAVAQYLANNNFSPGDDDTLAALSCNPGEVAAWSGSSWQCSPSATNDTLGVLSCGVNQVARFDGSAWICSSTPPDTLEALSCAAGEVAKFNGAQWGCAPDLNQDQLGALTSCAAGQVPKWNGSAWSCGNDGNALGTLSCANTQVPRFQNGVWTCAYDSDLLAGLGACAGGQVPKRSGTSWACANDDDTVASLSCAANQVPRYDGSSWVCATLSQGGPDTLSSLNCQTGELVQWNGSAWTCAAPASTTGLAPAGSIVAFHPNIVNPALPIPVGWMACDGSQVLDPRAYATGGVAPGKTVGSVTTPDLNGPVAIGLGGRFLRGGSTSGTTQTSANLTHTHGSGGLTASSVGDHSHTQGSLTIGSVPNHSHAAGALKSTHDHGANQTAAAPQAGDPTLTVAGAKTGIGNTAITGTSGAAGGHSHSLTGSTGAAGGHTHAISGSSASAGGNEARPYNFQVVWIMRVF